MLNLPNTTILSINCIDAIESVKAINYSRRNIQFKESILLTHENISAEGIRTIKIPRLDSVDRYNDFVLWLYDFVTTDYVLIVQDDGYVLNTDMFTEEFFLYDYIGAGWPNNPSWIEKQKLKNYVNFVGNGGFSLRSRKFLKLSSAFNNCNGYGEDVWLANVQYDYMIANGIKFAPIEVAQKFSRENNLKDWTNPGRHDINYSFGFHGKNFENHQKLINLKDQL